MTQEEKELLLRDLSARLTYGVIVDYKEDEYDFHHWKISTLHAPAYSQSGSLINTDSDGWIEYNEYKGCGMSTGSRPLHLEKSLPYLRPMSSMTKEEYEEYDSYRNHICDEYNRYCYDSVESIDWLNKKMFAYRTIDGKDMFELGLALEAPEGMYNLNKE